MFVTWSGQPCLCRDNFICIRELTNIKKSQFLVSSFHQSNRRPLSSLFCLCVCQWKQSYGATLSTSVLFFHLSKKRNTTNFLLDRLKSWIEFLKMLQPAINSNRFSRDPIQKKSTWLILSKAIDSAVLLNKINTPKNPSFLFIEWYW